ncbi:hypothetical protein [Crocosphaera sp. XPORK-15E]|uniref:hypothetical protein n=1 Tax=Crocosphaera sp. XPORK-15E TaxID=3110247 RepID=UPI002B1F63B2|nr:hypothetical protein [Crocosphaera sp. XPORK-15E]MEA5532512.1 hypothetical protein [Crocosphaera sp. XPORK-15E]
MKLPLYAEGNIDHYWIINLADQQRESYSKPYQKLTGNFDYGQRLIFLPHQKVELPTLSNFLLNLSVILPKNHKIR